MRALFFGSDAASLVALRGLMARGRLARLDVVCPVAKPQGRGKKRQLVAGPVRKLAEASGLRIFDAPQRAGPPKRGVEPGADGWAPSPEEIARDYDLGIVVSFGYFLPRAVIEAFRLGAVNLHPSLLPEYRGAAPIQRCLMNGDSETGVSIIKVDPERFDSGDILRQTRVAVGPDETYGELAQRLLEIGTEELVQTIGAWDATLAQSTPQKRAEPGFKPRTAFKITDKTRLLRFHKLTARQVVNRWRGLSETGGVYAYFGDKRLALARVRVATRAELASSGASFACPEGPGALAVSKRPGRVFVSCADGSLLEAEALQVAGKKCLEAEAFLHGYWRPSCPTRLTDAP